MVFSEVLPDKVSAMPSLLQCSNTDKFGGIADRVGTESTTALSDLGFADSALIHLEKKPACILHSGNSAYLSVAAPWAVSLA